MTNFNLSEQQPSDSTSVPVEVQPTHWTQQSEHDWSILCLVLGLGYNLNLYLDQCQSTGLGLIARHGWIKLLNYLLAQDCDIDFNWPIDHSGRRALHQAYRHEQWPMVLYLLTLSQNSSECLSDLDIVTKINQGLLSPSEF